MMDSLFIMQRYWGSDDDDDEDEENKSISYSDVSEESCRTYKKKKVKPSVTENTTNYSNVSEESCKTYKKKKVKPSVTENSTNCSNVSEESCKTYKKIKVEPSVTENTTNCSVERTVNNVDISNYIDVVADEIDNLNKTVEENTSLKKGKKHKSKKTEQENADDNQTEPKLTYVENTGENFCTIGQVKDEKDKKIRHALPHWLSNPTYIGVNLLDKETPISELSYLDSNSKKNLNSSGIEFLFPVQLAVIPWLMQSKEQSLLIRPSDICVSAPTGSGKTLAFVLPIVQSLKDRVVCAIRALVVLPVSELAIQVYKVFETFVRGTDLKVVLLTGQKSFLAEQSALIKSNGQRLQSLVDIVVTTPGRIYDHIYRTKGFCLKHLRYLVIDEADRMLDEIQQGWLKQVEEAVFNDCIFSNCVCRSLPRLSHEPSSAFNFGFISQPLQKLLYSATLTHDPEQLHSLSLYKPKLFSASVSSANVYVETCAIPPGLSMLHIICNGGIKPMIICHFIKLHNFKRVLCFTETVERAHRLHLVLEEMGLLQVREISSFNTVIQRKIVLEQFTSGKVDILVCSDLVARGIDIENIDCVISYDVPQSIKSYIHRIGRTARAGKTGTAVTLLNDGEIPHFKKMLKSAGIEMPEKVNINSEDLKTFVGSYQTGLMKADAKIKNEKKQLGRPLKNMKRKRK